jgi:hypothetical protein
MDVHVEQERLASSGAHSLRSPRSSTPLAATLVLDTDRRVVSLHRAASPTCARAVGSARL